jgi:3-hydroxyisobutyrate dehydrogenase-like beta-hydroxyacid dehydrogenase
MAIENRAMRIAFIGVGAMGAPMAERLLAAGHALTVFDVNAPAMQPLIARGARTASSARAAVAGAQAVFACLPSPEVSRQVAQEVAGAEGLGTYIETSTIGTAAVKAIAQTLQGISFIDAPVSGGPRGARAGTLSTMVSGERAAFERARPLLEAIAGKVFYMGAAPGLGQITKLANNMISAAGMAAACEAVVLAVKAGVDASTLIDAINAGTGRNSATQDKFPQSILPRTFDYGGKLQTMYKDVALCFEEARAMEVPMWVGASVVQLWFQAMVEGRAQDDYTTLIRMIEGWSGVTVEGRRA